MDLIPTPYPELRGRPMWIPWEGGRVWLLFHDHCYLQGRRKLMKEVVKNHPDNGGFKSHCQDAIKHLRAYERTEARWYAKFGLTPPKGGGKCIGASSSLLPCSGPQLLLKSRFFYHHKGAWSDYRKRSK